MAGINEVGLGLASLEDLDKGKIGALVRSHLKMVAADCFDRPGDSKPRTVTVEFIVAPKPIVEDDGRVTAETCSVQIKARSKVPIHQSRPYDMRITPKGLAYNESSPESFGQLTLDEEFVAADDD